MRTRIASLVAVVAFSAWGGACRSSAPPSNASGAPPSSAADSPHVRFAAFTKRFLDGYLERHPTDATSLGDHTHDDKWPDASAEGDDEELRWLTATRAELVTVAKGLLDVDDLTDASILANRLDELELWIREVRDAEQVPIFYTRLIGDGLDPLVTREFAPLDVRMKSLRARLAGVPSVVAVAKKRLQHPSRVATETAIEQTKGLLALCQGELPNEFAKVPTQTGSLEAANAQAIAALKDFDTFLKRDLLPRSDGSFRVGRSLFTKIVHRSFDDDVDVDVLANDARAAMQATRAKMLDTALELWPTVMSGPAPQPKTEADKRATIKAVLEKIADDHPEDATIVGEAKKVMDGATEFVRAHDLMRVPAEPVVMIEMPEYKRGVAVAYCESSGPFEAKPQTFIAISPPPADWPALRRASHYREYNRSMLRDLIVHEGMPGHYLQQMHANRVDSSVRAALGDGSYVEGWAVYGEWLMAKHGFGGPKVRMQQLKMLLRAAANAVLDHAVHVEQLEEKEAVTMLMNDAFQEEGEAVGKWKRARLSKGQLSTYYYGFRELSKLRTINEQKPAFNERTYNDAILALGAVPLRYVRERMQ